MLGTAETQKWALKSQTKSVNQDDELNVPLTDKNNNNLNRAQNDKLNVFKDDQF